MFKIKQRRDCYFDEFILFYFFRVRKKNIQKKDHKRIQQMNVMSSDMSKSFLVTRRLYYTW